MMTFNPAEFSFSNFYYLQNDFTYPVVNKLYLQNKSS